MLKKFVFRNFYVLLFQFFIRCFFFFQKNLNLNMKNNKTKLHRTKKLDQTKSSKPPKIKQLFLLRTQIYLTQANFFLLFLFLIRSKVIILVVLVVYLF